MNSILRKILIIIAVTSLILPSFPLAEAKIAGLDAPKDVISSITPYSLAQHNIRFGLPGDSQKVTPSDYILIDMIYFTNILPPTFASGGFTGTPVYSITNNRLRVTGISMEPGTAISLRGIRANNPPDLGAFDIFIRISSDADGQNIRNEAHIQASLTDESIVLKAYIPANIGQLRVMGSAGPGMLIAFTENNVVIGTGYTDTEGKFSQLLSGFTPSEHTIVITGTDSQNRETPGVEIKVFVQSYLITEVSGVIIPPTISLDKTQITRGESITVSGSGIPGDNVIITTEPPGQSNETVVDSTGSYSYTISNTNDMDVGDHTVKSMLEDSDGNQSLFSFNVLFKIIDPNVTPPDQETTCDLSKGDLNCDAHVNLKDFSILLYYWGTNNGTADINRDTNVNLIDFSIMMFYWGI